MVCLQVREQQGRLAGKDPPLELLEAPWHGRRLDFRLRPPSGERIKYVASNPQGVVLLWGSPSKLPRLPWKPRPEGASVTSGRVGPSPTGRRPNCHQQVAALFTSQPFPAVLGPSGARLGRECARAACPGCRPCGDRPGGESC